MLCNVLLQFKQVGRVQACLDGRPQDEGSHCRSYACRDEVEDQVLQEFASRERDQRQDGNDGREVALVFVYQLENGLGAVGSLMYKEKRRWQLSGERTYNCREELPNSSCLID